MYIYGRKSFLKTFSYVKICYTPLQINKYVLLYKHTFYKCLVYMYGISFLCIIYGSHLPCFILCNTAEQITVVKSLM